MGNATGNVSCYRKMKGIAVASQTVLPESARLVNDTIAIIVDCASKV